MGLMTAIRLATRGSALALAQSNWVAHRISATTGTPVELVTVRTQGDASPDPLAQIGGTGVFVSAVRDAVLNGEADLAVHSMKDLPTAPATGLVLAAVPLREDARDVLVGADGIHQLPTGASVGTGSPRRAAYLRRARADLEVVPIRGNVDTRLGMVASGQLEAVVLAAAGLARLGRLDANMHRLEPAVMLPAPGQGALAIECRSGAPMAQLMALQELDHGPSRAAVVAERAVLAGLEAGCSAPVGAHATVADGTVELTAAVLAGDGSAAITTTMTAAQDQAAALGEALSAAHSWLTEQSHT